MNAPGIATISAEGSDYDTVLGVFRGSISSPSNLVSVACNDDISASSTQSRLQFQVGPNINYWLAVNGTNVGTLKLTYGYDPQIQIAYIKSNGTIELLSTRAPSLQYHLLASTNLSTDPASWIVLLTTNFSTNISATNNVLRFVDTNVLGNSQRFFRIMLVP